MVGNGDSRLVKNIKQALAEIKPIRPVVYVSVSSRISNDLHDGKEYTVRWMCWSINDDKTEVLEPQFAILSPSITKDLLELELPQLIEGVEFIFDTNIDA